MMFLRRVATRPLASCLLGLLGVVAGGGTGVGVGVAFAAPRSDPGASVAGTSRSAAPAAPAPPAPRTPPGDRKDAPGGDQAPAPAANSTAPDLGALRAEYDRLREELFKARVRSQNVAQTVYASRLDARLRWKGGPDFVIRKARFLLDGAELWDSTDRAQTDDLIQVSERSVKPGPHALTVQLEIRPKTESKGGTKAGAEKLGYTSEHTFAIVVAPTGHTHLLLTGDEDGDPPSYEPELELETETEK